MFLGGHNVCKNRRWFAYIHILWPGGRVVHSFIVAATQKKLPDPSFTY